MANKQDGESTSAKVAAAAAKIMNDPKSSLEAKTVAASALAQSGTNKETSPEVAKAASKILKDPDASAEAKSVAASALTQRPDND